MKSEKKRKIIKAAFLSAAAAVLILFPLSSYRDGRGFALVQNSIFAAKPVKKNSQVKPPSDDTVKAEEKSESPVEDKSGDVAGSMTDDKPDENATLYDYNRVEPEKTGTGWMFFKFFLIIALLLSGFYFFFRFVSKKTGMSVFGRSAVDVLSAVPVGQNKFIQIVDVGGRMLVLGVTDANINLLAEITEKDQKDNIRLQSSKSMPGEKTSFQHYVENTAGFISEVIKKTSELTAAQREKHRTGRSAAVKESDFVSEYVKAETEEYEIPEPRMKRSAARDSDFYDYINEDKMNYLKKQKDRLKRLNGFDNE